MKEVCDECNHKPGDCKSCPQCTKAIESVLETIETALNENLDNGDKAPILLEPRKFLDEAIVGYIEQEDGHHIVYSEEKLIKALQKDMECDYAEALEFYLYNTVRALPYMKSEGPEPIILHTGIV